MPEANEVIYVVENSVAWLRLNRPEQMNAMTNGLMQGISAGIDNVREDPSIRALVITGEGRGFCAGADLNQVAQGTSPAERTGKPAEETQVDYFNKALADLKNCPVPTIAKSMDPLPAAVSVWRSPAISPLLAIARSLSPPLDRIWALCRTWARRGICREEWAGRGR